jgi:DNA-binding MltR family transcriptional regulator
MPLSARSERLRAKFDKIPPVLDVRERLRELQTRSGPVADRAAAIAGGVLVENALKAIIIEHFEVDRNNRECRDLFAYEEGGPLATFGTRISLAYCLGCFGVKTLADLRRIKKIRNIFAHTTEDASFDDPDIASICAEIETLAHFQPDKTTTDAKERYLEVAAELTQRMRLSMKNANPNSSFKIKRAPMP